MHFSLNNIEVEIFLGVPKEERAQKQKILVSIAFDFDTKKSAKTDDIKDTVDYFEIYKFIKNSPKNTEYKLLEKLHEDLKQDILEKFNIENLELKIQKFPFPDASVIVSD